MPKQYTVIQVSLFLLCTLSNDLENRPTLDNQWWDNPNTWEMPHFSRSQWPQPLTVYNGEELVIEERY
jgi:hypothetical protein